ncbi:EF-hand domain-containing protein [Terricaulis sp.]|uniref:EF-hand domain-containing protein n=1 Tax=Terricaulis sp. TaxID=2768686 RepID=UPI0037836548
MKQTTVSMLACATMLAACASGGGGADRGPQQIRALLSADTLMFVSFDADGDLRITADEISAGTQREFSRADTSGDGQLQPIEFQNWSNTVLGGTSIGPYRLDFDRNVDNVITRDEFNTEINGRVRDYDENEDGVLTRAEFVRLVGQARPAVQRREPTPTPGGRPPGM